jgi:hypothetical protein
MSQWLQQAIHRYERDLNYYEKKHSNELWAMLNNLDTYFETLKECGNPMQVTGGFIHPESDGIKAIDQKGGQQKVKLQQARLYVYPDVNTTTLYLLAIGDKSSQRDDVNFCRSVVRNIRKDQSNDKKI